MYKNASLAFLLFFVFRVLYSESLLHKGSDATIHMLKILPTNTGSAPVVEIRFDSKYSWIPCPTQTIKLHDGSELTWGREGKTYKYTEDMVKGSLVAFGHYNNIYEVAYYKCEYTHPCYVPIYDDEKEAKKLERFIFFRFTAIAAKDTRLFQKSLDNFMVALDIKTNLLFTYGAPSDYETIIGGNFIPLKWLPYETHPNTLARNLRFYQYDPIGYVKDEWDIETAGVKTNVVLYEWWNASVGAGSSYKTVKEKRFMPQLSFKASSDYLVRDALVPIASPYRDGINF
ncbi:MAG: hypothetical protein ACTTKH_06795 [Treponema sp.]